MGRKDESDLRLGHGKLLDPQHELRFVNLKLTIIISIILEKFVTL